MGDRIQPGVAVQNSSDVFIDYTSILDLSGPAVVRKFKSCTELVLACTLVAQFIQKVYPSNNVILPILQEFQQMAVNLQSNQQESQGAMKITEEILQELFQPIVLAMNIDVSKNFFAGLFEFVFSQASIYFHGTSDANLVAQLKEESFSGHRLNDLIEKDFQMKYLFRCYWCVKLAMAIVVKPREEWAEVPETGKGKELVVKHLREG
jgi:hypothetical protein